jgi:hypothetical protein
MTKADAADHIDHASADVGRLLLEAQRALGRIHRVRRCSPQAPCLFGCYARKGQNSVYRRARSSELKTVA